jgi:hypothetical protein
VPQASKALATPPSFSPEAPCKENIPTKKEQKRKHASCIRLRIRILSPQRARFSELFQQALKARRLL